MGSVGRLVEWIGRLASGGQVPPRTRYLAGVVLLLSATCLCLAASLTEVEGNPASRLASIETLVDHSHWRINDSVLRYRTVDKVRLGTDFYSSKPPLFAAIGAVLYTAVKTVTGWSFRQHQATVVALLRIGLQVLPFLLGLVLAGRFSSQRIRNPRVWFWGFLAFAAGTFVFGYSATVNNHSLAALLVLASMIGTFRLVERQTNPWWLLLGMGLVTGTAVVLDFGSSIFAAAVVLYLLFHLRRPAVAWFFVGAALPVLVHFHLTYKLTGSLFPFYGRDHLYDYPGSYWRAPRDFDALDEPTWVYAFHSLLGHHGLFSMTPLFFWSIPGIVSLARSPERRAEGWFIGIVCTLTVAVYIFFGPDNYGGTAMGMRWFIILAPLLWYAAVHHADRSTLTTGGWVLFYLCICLGMVHALAALTGPWAVSPWNWLLRVLGLGSVPPYRHWLPG